MEKTSPTIKRYLYGLGGWSLDGLRRMESTIFHFPSSLVSPLYFSLLQFFYFLFTNVPIFVVDVLSFFSAPCLNFLCSSVDQMCLIKSEGGLNLSNFYQELF